MFNPRAKKIMWVLTHHFLKNTTMVHTSTFTVVNLFCHVTQSGPRLGHSLSSQTVGFIDVKQNKLWQVVHRRVHRKWN